MSQEKVDRNKAAKASRKKICRKRKNKARYYPCMRSCPVCRLSSAGVVIPFIRDRLLIRLLKRLKWMLPHLQITRIR